MSEILSAFVGFVPGAVGGFFNVFVGHPIDLVKVRQQTSATSPAGKGLVVATSANRSALSLPVRASAATTVWMPSGSTIGMLRSIVIKEGVNGLYTGVSAPLLAVVPSFALSFWSYEAAKSVLIQRAGSPSFSTDCTIGQVATAGAFSGFALALVLAPLERIKCLLQVDRQSRYRGFEDCARQVYREGGLRGLFRGTALTLARDVPGNATYFATYEATKRILSKREGDFERRKPASMGATLLAGGVAGCANWLLVLPLDCLKSRWQTAPPSAYRSVVDVWRHLLETEGPTGLFRGLAPALLRAFPANAACLLGFESAKTLLALCDFRS